jgi:protease IV
MKKFLLGALCGIVFAVVAVVVLGFALVRFAAKSSSPEAATEGMLVLKLDGEVSERPSDDMPLPWMEQQSPWSVLELKQLLERAAGDSKVKALMLEVGGVGLGWGKGEEVRMAITEFKKSKKPVHAFLLRPNAKDYWIATVADRVSFVEEDVLDLKGLRAERAYYKNTLDKLGVSVEVVHAGKYKDFGDTFTRTSMTPESRESLGAILDGIYAVLVKGIAEGRKKTGDEVVKLMDDGPYLATAAKRVGLVDELEYEDTAFEVLAKKVNVGGKDRIPAREYRKGVRSRWMGIGESEKVAFLVGEGDIIRGSGGGGGFGGGETMIASRDFIRHVEALEKDDSFKAVLLRIDSPGGDAIASDELLAALKRLSKKKPMVVSMADVAASGGYYMAVTGDPIYAYPGTITGSIGVVYGRPNLKGLYEKIGMDVDSMQRGKNADIDALEKPLSPVAMAKLREGIDESYRTFVTHVAEGRKAKYEEIDALAQGRAWVASDVNAKRLTDQFGGIDAAFGELKKKAKLGSGATLAPYPAVSGALAKFFTEGTVTEAAWADAGFSRLLGLGDAARLKEVRAMRKALRPALLRGGMMRWMPYAIEVK